MRPREGRVTCPLVGGGALPAQDEVLKRVGTHCPYGHCDHLNLGSQAGQGSLLQAGGLPGSLLGLPRGEQRDRGRAGWEGARRRPGGYAHAAGPMLVGYVSRPAGTWPGPASLCSHQRGVVLCVWTKNHTSSPFLTKPPLYSPKWTRFFRLVLSLCRSCCGPDHPAAALALQTAVRWPGSHPGPPAAPAPATRQSAKGPSFQLCLAAPAPTTPRGLSLSPIFTF